MYRQANCYPGENNNRWRLCVNRKKLSLCFLVLFVEPMSGRIDLSITQTAITLATTITTVTSSPKPTTTNHQPTTTTPTTTTVETNEIDLMDIYHNPRGFMRFCDTDAPIYDDDEICNGVVGIAAHGDYEELGSGRIIASGIFIDDRHVLTSYSPFRKLSKYMNRSKIYINYLTEKWYTTDGPHLIGYAINRTKIDCARQVVAMEDKNIEDEQWHGAGRTHSPLHDLMVMQTNETIRFVKVNDQTQFKDAPGPNVFKIKGYFKAPWKYGIASLKDEFPNKFKIISLGLMDYDHVINKNHLHTTREYDIEDKILEDCEEWFPRDWGYFFCVKNDENFVGIGSGAILVNSDKNQQPVTESTQSGKTYYFRQTTTKSVPYFMVFGIGSFMLKKGKDSILVFTDVRPYFNAINMTCTEWDGHPN